MILTQLASSYLNPSDSQHELLGADVFPHLGAESLISEDQQSISFFTWMVQSIPVEGQIRVCSGEVLVEWTHCTIFVNVLTATEESSRESEPQRSSK